MTRPALDVIDAQDMRVGDVLWPTNRRVLHVGTVRSGATFVSLVLERVDQPNSEHRASFRRHTTVAVLKRERWADDLEYAQVEDTTYDGGW